MTTYIDLTGHDSRTVRGCPNDRMLHNYRQDVPHICEKPACPGNRNRIMLEAAEKMADALRRFLPEQVQEHDWWCPTCHEWIGGYHVTHQETHESCGTYLGDCQPNDKWDGLYAALKAYEEAKK